jgi:NADPH:quinone reductase
MRAVQVQQPGGPDSLLQIEIPEPQPRPKQVRVRAHAIGVGRPDVLIRMGTYKWMPPLPAIPGAELSGVIDAVGAEVKEWSIGDRVLVSARELEQRGGCYAEAIVVGAEAPYGLPDNLDFVSSVSLPNLQLALALLKVAGVNKRLEKTYEAQLGPSPSVLITGASGGVATMLAQAAKHYGYQTLGTSRSEEKKAFALANGFDKVIATQGLDLITQIKELASGRQVALAFDHLGGPMLTAALKSLAPLGTLVSYNIVQGFPADDVFKTMRELLGNSLAVRCFSMHTYDQDRVMRRELMQAAIDLMASGQVLAPASKVFPMSEVIRTHELLDQGLVMGKLVLKP